MVHKMLSLLVKEPPFKHVPCFPGPRFFISLYHECILLIGIQHKNDEIMKIGNDLNYACLLHFFFENLILL